MVKKWLGIGLVVLALVLLGLVVTNGFAQDDDEFTYQGEVEAPEFPEGLSWLNVSEPLTLEQLQGKIVILDFWTYGCINCMHIIPDLKTIEELYPNEVVVIGVHSAKFDNEGVTENIRQIVQRYEVEHPVVNDKDFTIWGSYGARAWPSIYVIDPLGKVVGRHEGESVYEVLGPVLSIMVKEYGDAGLLDTTPVAAIDPEISKISETPLLFPGKVLVDETGERLFIADTGHHRVVVADLNNYDVLQAIGTGEAGFAEGTFAEAQFNSPQGMALVGNILYVADTNNHAVRA
ncbi:MAG: redoxin domain-containing protein, partial [Anaerolineae bacterium]|nr:redoxin domain-containing protein [Anaerolineae bacterium]